MVVQHNLTAMNSNRMLGVTTSQQAKTTEKLSSGYKINRAADDAAGLAISEKMRKQIRGLTQASANAQDGISAVQTAEGALAEVHDMLQRMNELAVKAANGTNSESDREAIQAEVKQLTTEIDRVAETTKFNETYLLKGDATAKKGFTFSYASIEETEVATATFTEDKASGISVAVEFDEDASGVAQNAIANSLKNQGINVSYSKVTDENDEDADPAISYSVTLNGQASDKYKVVASAEDNDDGNIFEIQDNNGNTIATVTVTMDEPDADNYSVDVNMTADSVTAARVEGENYQFYDKDGNALSANALNKYFSAAPGEAADDDPTVQVLSDKSLYDAVGKKLTLAELTDDYADAVSAKQDVVGKLQVGLHVGADATSNNQITMNIEAMSAKGLGIVGIRIDGNDDSNALKAIETIKAALAKVSAQRSDLGAIQNRLEHTINNLDNVVENTTSAESQIRDTDMATSMVQYSNNNILAQAGTSMLAQANQSNQSVLSLLQ